MTYDLILARGYNKADRTSARLIVIHSMEAPEKPGTARAVAKWFAGPLAPQASAHFCVDNAEVIQCVREQDIAWGAPGANRDGLHVELAGYARQSFADWNDAYSAAELALASRLCADLAHRWSIPAVKLTVAQVQDTKSRGFCSHADVSKAFKKSTHTDPGIGFPWPRFIELVQAELVKLGEPESVA